MTPYHFKRHYTRDEVRALLPLVREWLAKLEEIRAVIEPCETRLEALYEQGCDVGGEMADSWVRRMADLRGVLVEFQRREIVIKDFDRGLVDFPSIVSGREVFLCWEKDEHDVEFWHDLDSGYAGRERL